MIRAMSMIACWQREMARLGNKEGYDYNSDAYHSDAYNSDNEYGRYSDSSEDEHE